MHGTVAMARMDALLPAKSPSAAALLEVFRKAARTRGTTRDAWHRHIDDLYGDLSGQRALARDPSIQLYRDEKDLRDLVQALQSYFVLLADLLAVARLRRTDSLASLSFGKARSRLAALSSGRLWKKLDVVGPKMGVPFDGYLTHLQRRDAAAFQDVAHAVETLAADLPGGDVMQQLYARLMPRNLLHAMGEFYTPPWLAELLLSDAGWRAGQSLLDPFAGSGVFLLAALARARKCGARPVAALTRLGGVDRNPVACVAARTNLILHLADDFADAPIRLPIVCSDSLLSDVSPLSAPADVLVTNPPWVGWEYVPRRYRDRLTAEWKRYDLYTARGRDAAFLKEDLSTLALVSVWDRFLAMGGTSAVVLRPAAMQSHLAARGLRRLSLRHDSGHLALRRIRLFPGLRLFGTALAPGAAWCVKKPDRGRANPVTIFPVPVIEWQGCDGWQPTPGAPLKMVRKHVVERPLAAARSNPSDAGSAWTIGPADRLHAAARLTGANDYQVRTGVFTGGGNGVYYVSRLGEGRKTGLGRYRNCPERARRPAPVREFELEDELVYEVVRGRDLRLWNAEPGAALLCPHTAATRMQAIAPERLACEYPAARRYLTSMRPILDARRGFSGWEQAPRVHAFYALQRLGAYSFLPYKVAWRYIATDFVVAVVGPEPDGRPRFCNDKVMFLGCTDATEAFFLCGLLSSDPVRWCVTATMTGTQISASAIRHLALPLFDAGDARHQRIAESCRKGHACVAAGNAERAQQSLSDINHAVAQIYRLSRMQMRGFAAGPRFGCLP